MFFHAVNLTEKTLHAGVEPWEFTATENITAQIRHDGESRQEWYQNASTKHYFYTAIEGSNPNQRPSKDNAPRMIHAFHAEYDIRIPDERIDEAIKSMEIKPAWVERSLGGNVRIVWTLPRPLPVDSYDFCCFVLTQAVKWLNLGLLPALDENAFTTPTRLLCNGCEWRATGHPSIPENVVQAFFVQCGKEFRFKPSDVNDIPLDVVLKAIVEKYPGFSWPGDFLVESQGPSFWVEGSTSTQSAIVKKDGMFTFSAHAAKPFYSWADILGDDFVKEFASNSIARATNDVWWDGKRFWQKNGGVYVSLEMSELLNFFEVDCRLSSKPGKDGISPVKLALRHIYANGRVTGAAPFIFRPSGPIDFLGRKILNTYVDRVMKPAEEISDWGASGKFPFLSLLFENLFDPSAQLDYFLAWWKHYYTSAIMQTPMPGQNTFLMGGANVGKTLTNRGIVGLSVGGFMDASEYLIHSGGFNSELMEAPLWCVDDETMGESSQTQANFQAMLKKSAANQQFRHNKKFEVTTLTEWMGRILVTTNLDYVSSRALGSMDNTSMDKTNIFRCRTESKLIFPQRYELGKIIARELPYLLRWLLNWDPPASVVRDVRFGYQAHHEKTLLDQAHQSGKAAPFKELLIEALTTYFSNCQENEWRGTVTQLIRLMHTQAQNEHVMRSLRLEQTNRYLEMVQREGLLECEVVTGELKTRIWVFRRRGQAQAKKPEPVSLPPSENSQFTK